MERPVQKITAFLVGVSTLAAPLAAAQPQDMPMDARPGTFIGTRIKVPLGASRTARPHAELAFAPTLTRTTAQGMAQTRIGEGLALNFGSSAKPTLTLAGVRADSAFQPRRQSTDPSGRKLGLSTGVVIAGGVLIAAAVGFALFYDAAVDNTE